MIWYVCCMECVHDICCMRWVCYVGHVVCVYMVEVYVVYVVFVYDMCDV